MSSEAKINANRKNARLSTGPNSNRGKEKSRRNAIKHGGYCRSILPGENTKAFDELLANTHDHFRTEGALEKKCAYHIARAFWLLDRLALAEQARVAGQVWSHAEPSENSEAEPDLIGVHLAVAEYVMSDPAMGSFERARAHIRRELDYYIDKLKDLQRMRHTAAKA